MILGIAGRVKGHEVWLEAGFLRVGNNRITNWIDKSQEIEVFMAQKIL